MAPFSFKNVRLESVREPQEVLTEIMAEAARAEVLSDEDFAIRVNTRDDDPGPDVGQFQGQGHSVSAKG